MLFILNFDSFLTVDYQQKKNVYSGMNSEDFLFDSKCVHKEEIFRIVVCRLPFYVTSNK